jgi:diacylglycerol kinase family enzyme
VDQQTQFGCELLGGAQVEKDATLDGRPNLQSSLSEQSISFLNTQVAVAHQGYLLKSGGRVKTFKRRYFVLSNDGVLTYFTNENMRTAPLGCVDLKLCTAVKNPSQCDWPASEMPKDLKMERRFELMTDSRNFRFYADSAEVAQIWLHKLTELKDKAQRAAKRSLPENDGLDMTLLQLVEDNDEDEDEDEADDDDDDDFAYVDDYFEFFQIPNTSERRHLLAEALKYNRLGTGMISPTKRRHVTILYNPVSGQGTAKKIVEMNVIPILRLANLEFTVVPTQYRGFANEHVNNLDLESTNAIIVAGGDGLVSEVITGLMTRTDNGYEKIAIGIVPSGTANAMANELDRYKSKSHVQLTTRAALGVASGNTRLVDVVECVLEDSKVYGLSCIGWGLAGAVGLQADKLRWLPGQRKVRYDIAGFVTMIKDWPVVSKCQFAYLVPKEDGTEQTEWRVSNWGFINFIASNVPKLGVDHPISSEVSIDDGYMAIAMLADNLSRTQVIQAALSMKAGKYLAEHKYVHAVRVKEFKIIPDLNVSQKNMDIPYNIDGDPVSASAVHVRILNKRLRVFQIPDVEEEVAE